jgi:hypothetical protein
MRERERSSETMITGPLLATRKVFTLICVFLSVIIKFENKKYLCLLPLLIKLSISYTPSVPDTYSGDFGAQNCCFAGAYGLKRARKRTAIFSESSV